MNNWTESYDYIVIGSGSAGSIVASNLAAADSAVLLIEAGTQPTDPRVWDPTQWAAVLSEDSEIEWGFQSQPQPNLDQCQPGQEGVQHGSHWAKLLHPAVDTHPDDRIVAMAQAKVYGGCSVHNAMVYVRGAHSDYNNWAAQGNEGWAWPDVLPHFEYIESIMQLSYGQSNEFIKGLIAAAQEEGLPFNSNYNANPSQFGSALFQFTIDGAGPSRESTFEKFIGSGSQPNLRVSGASFATRILCDGTRAVGVEYTVSGQVLRARAAKEVIVSAGAINSPKLLQLSGIGDAAQLRRLGIPVVADLPGVGLHFHDDLYLTVAFRATRELPPQPLGLASVVLFDSTQAGKVPPGTDLPINIESSVSSDALPGFNPPSEFRPGYWLWPNILHLKSTGSVRLQSSDPTVAPLIDPGYLTAPGDMEMCIEGLKRARAIGNAPALAPWREEEVLPGPSVQTDQELAEYIRCTASTTQHFIGSCRMGVEDDCVVDPQLRVRGVDGLRVIDSSILPSPVSGNTAAVSMMIGDKGAALVLTG